MDKLSTVQLLVTALLSSGFVAGLMTLITKKVWSPEATNDLARVGNEFAHLLLKEARTEREELRATIRDLEQGLATKDETIKRLNNLAREKDVMIKALEAKQYFIAAKIQRGEIVSLIDIFGSQITEIDSKDIDARFNKK